MHVNHRELRDPVRFEALFREFSGKIYRYAVAQLRNDEEALDVMSITFVRLWEYVSSREGVIENPSAFLYRIARNCVIDTARRRRPISSVEEMQEVGHEIREPREVQPELAEDIESMHKAMKKLREVDRDLLIWRFIEGIGVQEIAEMQSISENAASVRIYRALRRLRKIIEKSPKW